MELKKTFDFRKIVIVSYFVLLAVYLVVGLLPAGATSVDIVTDIEIPKIGLSSGVTPLKLEEGKFITPDSVVGAFSRSRNKTFLVGHSSGVFSDLSLLTVGDEILYDLESYKITSVEILPKTDVRMDNLLIPEEKETLIIMTCAGEMLDGFDATERLIITASIQ